MKTKKLTRAEKEARGLTKPTQSEYEKRQASKRAQIMSGRQLEDA
jgi:hypothetical protein